MLQVAALQPVRPRKSSSQTHVVAPSGLDSRQSFFAVYRAASTRERFRTTGQEKKQGGEQACLLATWLSSAGCRDDEKCKGSFDHGTVHSSAGKSNRSAMGGCVCVCLCKDLAILKGEVRGQLDGTPAVGFGGAPAQGCPRSRDPSPKAGKQRCHPSSCCASLLSPRTSLKARQALDFSFPPTHVSVNSRGLL